MTTTKWVLLWVALGVGTAAHAQPPAQPPPPRVVSPEIAADGKVTFRIRAAEARAVALTSGGDLPQIPFQQTLPLSKGADGVWSLTIGPVAPGAYRYAFVVDGVTTVDPAQPHTASRTTTLGASSACLARSSWTRSTCRMARSPRFGTSRPSSANGGACTSTRRPATAWRRAAIQCCTCCTARSTATIRWSTVGRAADIIDNLIAEGTAAPMIVVMPAGHQGPFTLSGGAGSLISTASCASSTATSGRTSRSTTRRGPDRSRRRSRGCRWAARRRSKSLCGISKTSATSACSARACSSDGADAVDAWGTQHAAQLDDKTRASVARARLARDGQGRLPAADDERDGRDAGEARTACDLPWQRRRPRLEQLARLPARIRAAAVQVGPWRAR